MYIHESPPFFIECDWYTPSEVLTCHFLPTPHPPLTWPRYHGYYRAGHLGCQWQPTRSRGWPYLGSHWSWGHTPPYIVMRLDTYICMYIHLMSCTRNEIMRVYNVYDYTGIIILLLYICTRPSIMYIPCTLPVLCTLYLKGRDSEWSTPPLKACYLGSMCHQSIIWGWLQGTWYNEKH